MVAQAVVAEPTLPQLMRRCKELEQRLTLGWQRIDEAILQGRDVRAVEERWISLLAEYERTCDEVNRRRR
jgi:hypothetical protein